MISRMRNFNKLDINSLKAFYYSAETKNFSKAATLSGFTQSGISQHVSKLEEELDVKLFRRGQRGVEITEAGILLKKFADGYLDSIDHLMQELDYKVSDLSGIVRYGMPSSCLKTPHFPLLLQARKDFPKIDLSCINYR
jgi:DNA-binding transcriptional LysR family regulator